MWVNISRNDGRNLTPLLLFSFLKTLCTFPSHAQQHWGLKCSLCSSLCCCVDKDIIPVCVNKRTYCAWGKLRGNSQRSVNSAAAHRCILLYSNSVCKHKAPHHIPQASEIFILTHLLNVGQVCCHILQNKGVERFLIPHTHLSLIQFPKNILVM